MISSYFGDDEGTAAEGPYKRLLKLRKWLYFSSALAGFNAAGLLQPKAVGPLLKGLIAVTPEIATTAILAGLSLTTIQYAALLLQLRGTYDIVLEDRIASKRRQDMIAAQLEHERIQKELTPILGQIRLLEDHYDQAVKAVPYEYQDLVSYVAQATAFKAPDSAASEMQALEIAHETDEELRKRIFNYLSRVHPPPKQNVVSIEIPGDLLKSLINFSRQAGAAYRRYLAERNKHIAELERLELASADYLRVVHSDPAARPLFLPIERFLDGIRTWPPLVAAVVAWAHVAYAVYWGLTHQP
ncbi:MAG TPA: hypothetical protein VEA44_10600 [Caulobacter sp.]|nr:hypothetical protein [Caulobacter sp.]